MKTFKVVAVGFNFQAKVLAPFAGHPDLESLAVVQAEILLDRQNFPRSQILMVTEALSLSVLGQSLRALVQSRGGLFLTFERPIEAVSYLKICFAGKKSAKGQEKERADEVNPFVAKTSYFIRQMELIEAARAGHHLTADEGYGIRSTCAPPRKGSVGGHSVDD